VADLSDLRREIRQKGERIARGGVIQMQDELRRTSPKVTRQLEKSITVRITSVGDIITAEAVAAVDHANPVIEGARPHVIRAKKAGGFLRFPDQAGVFIFRRSVNHPGNQPNLFWENGLKRWGAILSGLASRLR